MHFIILIFIIIFQFISQPFFPAFLFSNNQNNLEANSIINDSNYIIAQSLNRLPVIDDVFLKNQGEIFPPIRNWNISDFEINSKSILAVFYDLNSNQDKILYQKNINNKMPIASLTKIMTAIIVNENLNFNDIVKISKNAVFTEGAMGNLRVDEEISVENLLKAMLISSSNDAAVAFQDYFLEHFGKNLIEMMNNKAKEIGLENTHFSSPNGLDDKDNYSTAADLAKLIKYALRYKKIWDITRIVSIDIHSADGKIYHHLINTNALLNRLDNIYGGKTGYTEAAKESMVLIQTINQNFKDNNFIIYILLGSEDRFGDMFKLVHWIKDAYIFKF